jgi:hypothetical protein
VLLNPRALLGGLASALCEEVEDVRKKRGGFTSGKD